MAQQVSATPAALDLLERLRTQHGDLIVHLSGGCCDGSSPMCLMAAEMPPGPADVLLGEVAGAPFYIDADQDARWGHPSFEVDVAPGAATSFSLEGPEGVHFVARSPGPSDTALQGSTP
jgi:uncharacterized protein (DUF779 family)